MDSNQVDSNEEDGLMKRILAIALAGVMGIVFMSTDASAWRGKRRHYKRHYGYGHYIGPRYGRPYRRYRGYRRGYYPYAYGGRIIYYPAPIYRETYVYPAPVYRAPVYRETYVRTGPSNAGQFLGAILGGIGGGVIGHQIGGGSGKAIATVAGSLIGVLVGGEIGRQLDEGERLALARTTTETLETVPSGTAVPWQNPDSGTHGTVTPKPAYQNAQGEYCREYQQEVTISGKSESAYGTACRNPDGSWRFIPTR